MKPMNSQLLEMLRKLEACAHEFVEVGAAEGIRFDVCAQRCGAVRYIVIATGEAATDEEVTFAREYAEAREAYRRAFAFMPTPRYFRG